VGRHDVSVEGRVLEEFGLGSAGGQHENGYGNESDAAHDHLLVWFRGLLCPSMSHVRGATRSGFTPQAQLEK
jgi:hypothetical protein